MITISPAKLVYEQKNFCGSLCTLLEYFIKKKLPSDRCSHLGQETFTELFLSNIMKYGKNYIYYTMYEFEWFLGLFEEKRRKF